MSVRLLAEVTLPEAAVDQLADTVTELVAASRKDQGCLQYDVFRKADGFVFIEHWQDEAALKAHEATPHFQKLGRAIDASNAQLRIEVLSEFIDSTH
ncbi:putative quinol monooxygenase [Neisseriaceae bacterium ESL0693]|nr:putative quinol monooxygenase [Neisseriaceae bacterium ESL0693]